VTWSAISNGAPDELATAVAGTFDAIGEERDGGFIGDIALEQTLVKQYDVEYAA
jgi:hypothetical protein